MKNELRNKITDTKKADNDRRIKLGMLGLLIEEFPKEAMEKLKKQMNLNPSAFPGKPKFPNAENSLVLRE